MSETTTSPATTTPSKAKKPTKTALGAKKTKAPATHPPVSDMVLAAVKELKERNGSSAQAIKKYIGLNYKVEVDRLQPFIKKYLKSAVISGALLQTKGKGASGSFKLSATQTKEKKPTVAKAAPKPAAKAAPKKAVIKKTATPSKATKAKKTVEKKPKTKSPKVKKTVEKKSKTPKTVKSPKKVRTAPKPKPAKKIPMAKKVPQRSTRKA